jgi:hypothetical protein
LSVKQGLNLKIKRLSRVRSSSELAQDERIFKGHTYMLVNIRVGLLLSLPVKAETPRCSNTRVCPQTTRHRFDTEKNTLYTRSQTLIGIWVTLLNILSHCGCRVLLSPFSFAVYKTITKTIVACSWYYAAWKNTLKFRDLNFSPTIIWI